MVYGQEDIKIINICCVSTGKLILQYKWLLMLVILFIC